MGWFLTRVWTQLLDEPEERWRAARLLTQVLGAGAISGWLIATFLSAGVGVSTVPGATTEPLNIIAREPGPAYDVRAFCNDPETTVVRPTFPMPEDLGRLTARRGTEEVVWPGGGSPVAMRYWLSPAGIQQSEPVDFTPKAAECFAKKVR